MTKLTRLSWCQSPLPEGGDAGLTGHAVLGMALDLLAGERIEFLVEVGRQLFEILQTVAVGMAVSGRLHNSPSAVAAKRAVRGGAAP